MTLNPSGLVFVGRVTGVVSDPNSPPSAMKIGIIGRVVPGLKLLGPCLDASLPARPRQWGEPEKETMYGDIWRRHIQFCIVTSVPPF